MLTETEIKARIIRKLVKWRKWGASHTENILKGLPSHLKGDKITKKVLKKLVQNEWLITAIKTKEIHYSLNPEKTDEILQFYEKWCNEK
ncbi:hypothetical protein GOV03_00415 [Candidatus Woesearchaeota archaeon]|nr:hypothetical protein [Candidatus Woesearchaeota archaeon]